MSIKIIVADDHPIVRIGLRNVFEKCQDFEVIGEAANGETTVKLSRELSPDVIVMDISMPDMSGIEATRSIINESPHVKVIALSMHSDKEFMARMLEVGAKGYLVKGCSNDELVSAVRAVVADQTYMSSEISP
jgi:DNA-binding NarL/FixJ family response regulator